MSTELTVHKPLVKASTELSAFLGMEVSAMIDTIKAQCFKGKRPDEVSDAQLATYVSVANALKLNPLLPGQMYPYPDRNGSVTVMLGPDGIFTLLSNNPDIVAQKDGGPAFWAEHGKDPSGKDTCTGYVNHRTKGLLKKTIWVDEWVVTSNPNWTSRRHHMSEIRALKQAARMVIHGMPMDADEHRIGEMLNVTDSATPAGVEETQKAPERAPIPEKKKKGAAAAAAAIEVTTTTPPPAETKPQETATPPAQQEAAKPAEKPAEKPVERVAEKLPPTPEKPPQPPAETEAKVDPARAFIKDGEEIIVDVVVKKASPLFATMDQKRAASVIAKVEGQYNNEVIHHDIKPVNLRTENGKEVFDVPEIWAAGGTLRLKLLGRHFPAAKKVYAVVQSVESIGGAEELG